jgi:hypothetical protein
MIVEFQLGDLHAITGIYRRAVRSDGAIEHLGLQRLAHADMETLFTRGQRLDGFGKFTGDVADQSKLRIFLERGVFRGGCGFRLGLALGLRVVLR